MEIRCCCTPGKLLGSVPVRDGTLVGDRVKFWVAKPSVRFDPKAFKSTHTETESVILEVAEVDASVQDQIRGARVRLSSSVALKSGGYPLDVLSRIPGFIPAEMPSLSSLATKDPAP